MTERELYDLITEALEVPAGSIAAATVVAAVEEWGSLGWLTVLALLDERASVTLSAADIAAVATVGDLAELLRSRGKLA